ncbi:MAG: RluA family pseudouridine synthase [Clostridia bacterium]|nr:RluA family pseudouridine synthase [Clostridia bacterium]
MTLTYQISNNESFDNIKHVLKSKLEISDRLLLKLKSNSNILLNGKIANVKETVKANDIIEVILDYYEDNSNIVPTKMNLSIIYEDDSLLIINKPAGFPIHPSMLHFEDSISNGVKYYFDKINLCKKIRPVNRLDKDTSGIVIFAKNEYIQEALIKQMKSHTFIKEYIAICEGKLPNNSGTITAPIARKPDSIIERCVNEFGDTAVTHYKTLSYNNEFSVVHFTLETGRTHQIRVHTAYIGNPIIGDTLYGHESSLIARQALHSYKVTFIHPITHNKMQLTAPLFPDMEVLILKV